MIDVWLATIPDADDPGVPGRRTSALLGRRAAHELARTALGSALGVEPALLRLAHRCRVCGGSDHGVPYLPDFPEAPHVSLSRTSGLVGVALCADAAVGLDLERVGDLPDAASDAMLAPEEDAGSPAALAVRWVRKEAALKASGHGLAVDPRTVVVSSPRRPARVLTWPLKPPVPALVDLDLGPHQVGCVAVVRESSRPLRVTLHRVTTANAQLHRERSLT